MTNILNTHVLNNGNAIPARKISDNKNKKSNDIFVEAPSVYNKYSITKDINKMQDFRESVLKDKYVSQKKTVKRKNNFVKLSIVFAAVAGFFFFKGKK